MHRWVEISPLRYAPVEMTMLSQRGLGQPHTRIEPGIENVHKQIDHYETRRDDEYRCLYHREVATADRCHQQLANAIPLEDLFGDNRARQQVAEVESNDGDERYGGVLERV